MSKGLLKIGAPSVRVEGDKAILAAIIYDNGENKELTYKVDIKYAEYLTCERSDAFVTSLLYYAMVKEYDIQWEVPCTEQLIYQLETYFIPVCDREISFLHSISLSGILTDEKLTCKGAVAAGFSGGVDSCYTVYKYVYTKFPEYKLTHLLFTDCFTTDFAEEGRAKFLEQNLSTIPNQAKELGLEFIFVEFHIDEQFSIGRFRDKVRGEISDNGLYTLKYCSLAMALSKLIKLYYYSSSELPSDFSFQGFDCSFYDMFTVPNIVTSSLGFYLTGMELGRIDKVEQIADWEFAHKHLLVCAWDNDCNCGRCGKCIRTMSELYALGKLDKFSERFPIEDYKKHLTKRFAVIIRLAHSNHPLEKHIIEKMKENNRKIPLGSYFLAPFYFVIEWFRSHLCNVRWARRIYRKFHIDKLLYGRSTKMYTQRVDREILGDFKDD